MTNKEIVEKNFIESYPNHNFDFAMNYIADNYLDHIPEELEVIRMPLQY